MTGVSAVLEDGGQVNIRQADAGDEPELAAFYARLGVHDGHLWSPRGRSAATGAAHEAAVPVPIGQSVTAWANDELIGVADYRTLGSTREAEVTVGVTGRGRGRGIETLLLEHLISSARQRGIESFHADVQADNSEMLLVLANLGLTSQPQEPSGASPGHANRGPLGSSRRRSGSVAFDLSLRYDERYLEAVAERESRADVFSLRRVFAPRSVAIVGASRREVSVGNAVVRHLLEADFHGPVYPVNPHADRIAGLRLPLRVGNAGGSRPRGGGSPRARGRRRSGGMRAMRRRRPCRPLGGLQRPRCRAAAEGRPALRNADGGPELHRHRQYRPSGGAGRHVHQADRRAWFGWRRHPIWRHRVRDL